MAQWRVTIRGVRVEGPSGRWQHVVTFVYQQDYALDDQVQTVRDLGLAAAESHGVEYSLIEKVELVYTGPRAV